MSVDLPEPLTPVTTMSLPSGNSTSTFFRLFPRAPLIHRLCPLPSRRCSGVSILSVLLRYPAVMVSCLSISCGVP